MDATLLIAENDVRSGRELRRFFSNSGFLVAAVANGLECRAALSALEPDVLVIALEIPRGGGDGVIARLNGGSHLLKKPLILVIGAATVETLSARTGVPRVNCFSKPLQMEDLLDRIGMDFALRLLLGVQGQWGRSKVGTIRTLAKEGTR
jgi:DNA-binding NtrC family response regulator